MATGGAYVLTRPSASKRPPSGGAGLPSAGSAGASATPITYKPSSFGNKKPPAAKSQKSAKSQKPGKPPAAKPVDPLAPLTPQQIRQQARKTIRGAYSGALTDVDQQRQQAQNLYKTQATDDAAFQQWLTSSAQALQSQTDTVNQKLTDVLAGMRATQSQQLNAVPGQLASSEAQPGGSNPAQLQQGLTNLTSPFINAAEAHANVEGIQQAQTALGGNNLMAGSAQVASGQLAQLKGQQAASLDKAMQSIASERAKLIASRTGDIAKEIARLNGIEISKAQFRSNQANLQQELGLKQQGVDIQKQNANTSALRAQEVARHNAQMEKINSTHYSDQATHDAAVAKETARHNAVTEAIGQQNANTSAKNANTSAQNANTNAAKAGGRQVHNTTPTQRHEIGNYISRLRNALIQDMQKYGRTDLSVAYHDISSGRFPTGLPAATPLGIDPTSLLNIAANSLTQYGSQGLSPGDVTFLQSYGINPANLGYPVKQKAPPNAGRVSKPGPASP